jgi:hypothetical protein
MGKNLYVYAKTNGRILDCPAVFRLGAAALGTPWKWFDSLVS